MTLSNSFSQQIKTANTDEWYTPASCVRVIVPYLLEHRYTKILCPFDTENSNYVKVLKTCGFDVTYSHIHTGTDFFGIDNLADYDAVVSNPPFSKRQQVFESLFSANVPFAMVTNFNGLFDAKSRWELFKNHDFEIIVPKGHIKFFNDGTGRTSQPNFQSVYVCRGMSDRQIDFAEVDEE